MGKPAANVTGRYGVQGLGQRGGEHAGSPRLGRPQLLLNFGDARLPGVEVGGGGEQITAAGARGCECGARLGGGVQLAVVSPPLVARAYTGDEQLLAVAGKDLGVEGSLHQTRSTEAGHPQGTED
jgi:hypothetical protein